MKRNKIDGGCQEEKKKLVRTHQWSNSEAGNRRKVTRKKSTGKKIINLGTDWMDEMKRQAENWAEGEKVTGVKDLPLGRRLWKNKNYSVFQFILNVAFIVSV